MSKLKSQIHRKKTEIDLKRRRLKENWHSGKRNFGRSKTFDLSLLGGIALGYFIMPRRLGKFLIRAWSLYTTVSQLSSLFVQRRSEPEEDERHIHHEPSKTTRKLRRVK